MTGATEGLPILLAARAIHTGSGEAEAVVVRNGRVAEYGAASDLRREYPLAGTLELPGMTITPGLTDAHVHLLEWALSLRQVDLTDADSPRAAAAAVAGFRADRDPAPGGWIRGRGWDPHRWSEVPQRRLLDEAVGDVPVALQSHDMHSYWASSAALAAAGITAGTPDPDGGRIERDADGEPTGVLRDNAIPLLLAAAPTPTEAERREALLDGQTALHRLGITGVHTVEPDSLGLLERVRGEDGLRLRVLQHLGLDDLDAAIRVGLRSGFGGPWLRIGGVKMFLDGALGSRTAWLREPYEGSDDRGLNTLQPDAFEDAVRRAAEAGIASTVHAIGDAAMDLALDVLTRHADALTGPVPHRNEHAQLMAPDQLGQDGTDLGAATDIVLSVQPSHLMTDWRAADRHWGERTRWTYAFRSMEAAGYTLALGSDAPVEPPDPREGLVAAVTRTDRDGRPEGGWVPDERLSMDRAWAGYTTGAATAAGDPRQGRLEPGAFADLVAWDVDPLTADPDTLRDLEPALTMIDGEVVWRA